MFFSPICGWIFLPVRQNRQLPLLLPSVCGRGFVCPPPPHCCFNRLICLALLAHPQGSFMMLIQTVYSIIYQIDFDILEFRNRFASCCMELLGWTVAGTLGHVAGLLLFLEAGGTFKASVHLRGHPLSTSAQCFGWIVLIGWVKCK